MQSAAAPPARPAGGSSWLFGPGLDLIFGCGLGYALVFLALTFTGATVQLAFPFALLPILALFIGAPHYGATLLRVYARGEDFRKYLYFSLVASLLVWGLFTVAVHQDLVSSVMVTIFLTWSPWHYSGQNYGISLMFLRRRGITVSPLCKRLFYGTFVTSFLFALVRLHGGESSLAYFNAAGAYETTGFLRLGIPPLLASVAMLLLGAVYVACLAGSASLLLRGARPMELLPAAAIVASQALWFVVPAIAQHLGAGVKLHSLAKEHAAYAFFWIALAHMAQYLWITAYYDAGPQLSRKHGLFYARALGAGAAVWAVPALVFAPHLLGRLTADAGLGGLVAAAVNLQHFILDGAIWKLRDSTIASLLLRSQRPATNAAEPRPSLWSRPLVRPTAWAVGLCSVALLYASTVETELGLTRAFESRDLARLERSCNRLYWMGKDSARARSMLALLKADAGQLQEAVPLAEAAVAMQPTPWGYQVLGNVYERAGRRSDAARALRRSKDLETPVVAELVLPPGRQ